jgi:TetR/AcrR family transcriptional regulator, regulator of cefoperazone and chloramphenicol sensitivity
MTSATSQEAHKPRARTAAGAEGTRDKLIEAAGRVFAERGFDSATVREICRRAGANVAAVNYHFGDKIGLYTAVLQQSVNAAHVAAIRTVLDSSAPPEEMLRSIIRARLEGVTRQGRADWQVGILAHEFAHPTPAMAQIVNTVARPLHERLLELVGRILGCEPHDVETLLCAHSVMGQIFFYVLGAPALAQLWPQAELTPDQVPRIADHIADFSLAYMRQAAAKRRQVTATPGSRTAR